ncbi:MAG TPA: hypothetical protein ACFE0H_00040 [Elainellaceae cyanobacterium]
MTKPLPARHQHADTPSSRAVRSQGDLNYRDTYICPVCRHGQISALTLMDAFACSFCRHIFTANLNNQSVQVVDSSQPMSWRWTGRTWQAAYQNDSNVTLAIWLVGISLVVFPSAVVCIFAYMFPPMPGSQWAWFPVLWCGITIVVHLGMVSWLMAEHYQIPVYVSSKIRLRRFLSGQA